MRFQLFLSLLFSLLFFNHLAAAESGLTFEDAWVAEAPPVSKVMAAYMEIKNSSEQAHSIISASSDNFERIEFHQSTHINNIASMKQVHKLVIPAKGELELKAGGYHMMLFNPVKKLKAGDQVSFSFKLENGDVINVVMPVKKQDFSSSPHDHHSHEHHH